MLKHWHNTVDSLPLAQWLSHLTQNNMRSFLWSLSPRQWVSTAESVPPKDLNSAQLPFMWNMELSVWKTTTLGTEYAVLLTLRLVLVLVQSMLCCTALHWGKCSFPDITAQEGELLNYCWCLFGLHACSLWVSYMEMEMMPYLWTGRSRLLPVSPRSSCFLLGVFSSPCWGSY